MNINIQGGGNSILSGFMGYRGLKSTQERLERQEQRDSQIALFEQRKEDLKSMKCTNVEEIAEKLKMFHSYEEQIAAAKAAYNSEQMWHIMDESREKGEKIAEAVDKMEPKTPEERLEELVEEAAGVESGGIMEELEEVMDEAAELQEELQEELPEDMAETLSEELQDILPKEQQPETYTPFDVRL